MADSFLRNLQRSLTGGVLGFQLNNNLWFSAQALFDGPSNVIAPAAAVTPNLLLGNNIFMTFTANTAVAFAIPTGVPAGLSAEFTITIINTSGGALTNITWGATYKLAALTFPATTKNRTFAFWTDGTNAYELYQTAADVAN